MTEARAPYMVNGQQIRDRTGHHVATVALADEAGELAAAPELAAALRWMLDAAETEPGMRIYRAHMQLYRNLLARLDAGQPETGALELVVALPDGPLLDADDRRRELLESFELLAAGDQMRVIWYAAGLTPDDVEEVKL